MIDISIIVPIYNVEKYLEDCINSIINQTFKNFELILVDDGSTDKSGEICDKFVHIDNRIRVIHQVNKGISGTRNMGIDISKGKYILFIDGDDYIHPKMCEILYNQIEFNNSDLAIFQFKRTKKDYYNQIINNIGTINAMKISNKKALEKLYIEGNSEFIFCWSKLYKKELFDNIKFDEGRIYEDQLISKNILYRANNIIYLPIPLYYYRYRQGSYTNLSFNKNNLDIIYAYKEDLVFFNKINYKFKYKIEEKYIFYLFKYYFIAKHELCDCKKELKNIRRDFSKCLPILLKSSMFKSKEKIAWIIFFISPTLYEKISK